MSQALDPIILNFLYASLGGLLAIGLGWAGAKLFSLLMPFSVGEQLGAGNIAVGLAVMGIFIGVGISMGLVIGMGLN